MNNFKRFRWIRKLTIKTLILYLIISTVGFIWKLEPALLRWFMITEKNFLSTYMQTESIFLPTNISEFEGKKYIACFISSAPNETTARNTIRHTWGKLLKPIFILAKTESDNQIMQNAIQEAREYNDIIIEDFTDTYRNLTIKTAFAMKNFLKYFKNADYFLKVDDDVLLDVERLYNYLKTVPKNQILGKAHSTKMLRNETFKNHVPKYLYHDDKSPTFAFGATYMIPGELDKMSLFKNKILLYLNILSTKHDFFKKIAFLRLIGYTGWSFSKQFKL